MKSQFIKTVCSVFRLWMACLVWILAVVQLLASKASYRLTRRLVDKETRDTFDRMKSPVQEGNMTDYHKRLNDLLRAENEVTVGYVREMIEKTQPGQRAVRHVQDRRPYAVLYPTKDENIIRVLNAFDAFPQKAFENAFNVIEDSIRKFNHSGTPYNGKKEIL